MKKKIKTIVSLVYGTFLASLTTLIMLETFVFPSTSGKASNINSHDLFSFDDSSSSGSSSSSSSGGDSSSSEISETTISYQEYEYTVSSKKVPYIIVTANLKKISDFRTSVATDSSNNYGSNITSSFSSLISEAEEQSGDEVLFAIDGDFPFWSGRNGYVIRNGISFRTSKRSDSSNLDMAIFKDGTFSAYDESNVSFDKLSSMNGGCYQNWSFGPALLVNSSINVTEDQDVSQTKSANQRVGMGYKDDGTIYFLCSNTNDGQRGNNSVGLSLYNMATIFQDLGCSLAYNFDGGGSANMYIKGYGSNNYYMKQTRTLGDIVYVVNA